MEAIRDFLLFQDTDRVTDPAGYPGVTDALAVLQRVSSTAVADAASWGFRAASDFAGQVEELSRTMEYLQLVAAAAVDRTRKQATANAGRAARAAIPGWTTGWRDPNPSAGGSGGSPGAVAAAAGAVAAAAGTLDKYGATDGPADRASDGVTGGATDGPAGDSDAVDDGYRNTTEFLRARLRISAPEARRRLALAEDLLPRTRFGGRELLPPVRAELGAAVASAEVASRAASIITVALDRVRHACDVETSARMEHALTRTAAENDPDFLVRVARSWTDAIDQDGAEPSEELLRQLQGAFIRKPRHGLHHLEIFATAEQFEHLLAVMNTATNPRTPTPDTANGPTVGHATPGQAATDGTAAADGFVPTQDGHAGASIRAGGVPGAGPVFAAEAAPPGVSSAVEAAGAADEAAAPGTAFAGAPDADPPAVLDLRTRPQKLLDGLVGAAKVALAAGTLPATGGLRPQVMVTIDYRDLLTRLRLEDNTPDEPGSPAGTDAAGSSPGSGRPVFERQERTGTLLFTGPVTASTARKIACDADIIPVLLGGEGRILDIGRSSRIFPPHIRKALTARDQGCSFPGCTIPAPWCEAHHISYWSRGGSTGTDNGTLLCSHHHHLIHKEHWTIQLRTGVPWFIPPPHLDPRQRPRRNTFFHPDRHPLIA
ncbi:HNH endonuclease signature motif containing protein [Pseudarthrobacter sp. MM222]|uniref:HNH endonuclease signature motif containing protein n=1 Tax=Pseudarthrobacter sp. MM222 TaxID=3018929 RepID=UPI00221F1BEF|nr:HNH endonuclease signature motif containing protein [Pseudarthrobacter sp. MM222]CAI3796647.1 hypothetical protein NKCBBBOE_01627 [Pseudarthrobacter sp. MM222]